MATQIKVRITASVKIHYDQLVELSASEYQKLNDLLADDISERYNPEEYYLIEKHLDKSDINDFDKEFECVSISKLMLER